jgi:hypothetical protein
MSVISSKSITTMSWTVMPGHVLMTALNRLMMTSRTVVIRQNRCKAGVADCTRRPRKLPRGNHAEDFSRMLQEDIKSKEDTFLDGDFTDGGDSSESLQGRSC